MNEQLATNLATNLGSFPAVVQAGGGSGMGTWDQISTNWENININWENLS